jgi:CBS domain-containing protein
MKKIRLLIVDEQSNHREFFKDLLKESDLCFEIDEANTSLLALDKLKENGFDCVLSNHIIPGVSGLDVMNYAKGLGVQTPFILFTIYGNADLAEELIKRGVAAFLLRDEWNLETLQYKINAVLSEEWRDDVKSDDAKIKNQKIGELMSSPPHNIDSDKTIDEVINKMNSSRVGSLLVIKDGGYVGIITKSDLIRKAIAQKIPRDTTKVSVLMTSSIITLESNTSAEEAYEFLKSKRIRHLAVTEGGSIVGVVSVKDLIQK